MDFEFTGNPDTQYYLINTKKLKIADIDAA